MRTFLRTTLPLAVIAGAGAAAAQRRHLRAIAADPAASQLELAAGRAVPVRSADGTVLHAEVFGPEDAPTIVLAHGWVEALRLWVHVIPELENDFRIVAYDHRAHGASGRARTGDYSTTALADDLDAVLRTCVPDGRRAIVAGHSMGAMAIAAWAEDHDVRERVCAAAMLNTGVGNLIAEHRLVRTPLDATLREPLARRLFLGNGAPMPKVTTPIHHAALRHIAFGPDVGPATVEFMLGMVRQCREADRAAFGLSMADMDLHHALANLTVPTLVMAGEDDRLTPASHAVRMADELPDLAELVIVPRSAHMGPLECPSQCAAALRSLAERASVAPGPLATASA